jgi:RNA polymerase sigma-70 factor (ECF subfamily)
MNTTSLSLLERLRSPSDDAAWRQFVDLYTPLLCQWARRAGLQESDVADLVQDVFTTLVRVLPEFQYDSHKSFRGWLKTVLMNRWRNQRASRRATVVHGPLEEIPAPEFPEPLSEAEYRALVVAQAMRIMEGSFEPVTWQTARACLMDGQPAAQVAAEWGISINSVYLARSRVLKKLRQELAGFLDEC